MSQEILQYGKTQEEILQHFEVMFLKFKWVTYILKENVFDSWCFG